MIDGLLVVDKPAGWTSHDVVGRCRRLLGQKRVGHAGTLDPDATGVLLIGAGRVTRLLRYLSPLPKEYAGELVLGTATTTLDASGEVTGTWDMSDVSPDAVAAGALRLTGAIEQVPPMVSAVQVGGVRLHQLARQGREVERAPRPVTVHRFTVEPTPDPLVYGFEVSCSSGTYVRSLADDLGRSLGGGAHLRSLRRTAIGPFGVDRSIPLESVTASSVLRPADAMSFLDQVVVDGPRLDAVRHGRRMDAAEAGAAGAGPWAVVTPEGVLVAVYEAPVGAGQTGREGMLRAGVVVEAG